VLARRKFYAEAMTDLIPNDRVTRFHGSFRCFRLSVWEDCYYNDLLDFCNNLGKRLDLYPLDLTRVADPDPDRIQIGSGFNRVSGSGIRIRDSESGSRRAKMTHKSRKK
jgi:hypothetical protein